MEFNNNMPIYQQIVDIIKQKIISGELKCGDKIKPVRELAEEMNVNPNTVQKALSYLEFEKILYSERTVGRYVTNSREIIDDLKKSMIFNIIKDFFHNMEQMGIDKKESLEIINEYLKGGI